MSNYDTQNTWLSLQPVTGVKFDDGTTQTTAAVSGVTKYSSGYFYNASNGVTITKTHGLGTTDIICELYVADDVDGTNNRAIAGPAWHRWSDNGCMFIDITTTALSVSLGDQGYTPTDEATSGGPDTNTFAGKYLKIIAMG